MLKQLFLLMSILMIGACTRFDFRSEELQPIQSNYTDGDLSILILTESTLISQEASEKIHRRRNEFPPRILIYLSADDRYKDVSVVITSLSLKQDNGKSMLRLNDLSFTLRDSWHKDIQKYETYGHLKNLGGTNTVRDIFITPWIQGIEVDQNYTFSLGYINMQGEKKLIEIGYKAVLERRSGLMPAQAYWGSI